MWGTARFSVLGVFPGATIWHGKACQPSCADNVMEESRNESQS